MIKTYLTFFRFLLAYRGRMLLFGLLVLCFAIVESILPYFYKLFVDVIPQADYQLLFNLVLIYTGVRILNHVLDIAAYTVGDTALIPAARDARLAVFRKIQDLDFAFHLSKSTGTLISTIKRGDGAFFDTFHTLNIEIPRIFVHLIIVLLIFSTLGWQLTVAMFITFLVNAISAYFLIRFSIRKRAEFNDQEDHISDIIVDNLINYETVKLFAKEQRELDRLRTAFADWSTKLWGVANSFRAIDVSVGTFGSLGLLAILWLAMPHPDLNTYTPGDFALVLGFVTSFYPRFYQLVFKFRHLAKNYTDIFKYFDILSHQTLIQDPEHPLDKSSVRGEIEFRNVTFTYPEGSKPSLKNFNLKIRQGQSVALVGSSGVGKTTIVKLLMRFYDVDSGEILIDGQNIKHFTKSRLRSYMGVVPQEPILFNNTIGFNVGYASAQPSQAQIQAAAQLANLDEFINTLPHKYSTQVGERGIKLSGGQKQRLAIARMILANPDIIIFDEATSHLDSQSEKLIQDAFWKAARDKTTLIVAHRLSTIVKADLIVVLRNGRVVESGSHRALLTQSNSLYGKFWNLQTNQH